MTTKLTLTVDASVIETAKEYARHKGESLSHLVEQYLRSLTEKDQAKVLISPTVKNLMGVVSLPDSFEYKSELRKALSKKYNQ
jgi:hypothetical protein